jgi:hypothetical protein
MVGTGKRLGQLRLLGPGCYVVHEPFGPVDVPVEAEETATRSKLFLAFLSTSV